MKAHRLACGAVAAAALLAAASAAASQGAGPALQPRAEQASWSTPQQRAQEQARKGVHHLRQYIQRTRMIHHLWIHDFQVPERSPAAVAQLAR